MHDWIVAYNQRDAHAAAELYHEDATNYQVALGPPTVGRQAILDELISFFHAFPDNLVSRSPEDSLLTEQMTPGRRGRGSRAGCGGL